MAGAEKLTAADGERQTEMGFAMASATQRGAPAGQPVVFDSPVGWLGVAVSPAGLRRVLLPNSAGRAGRVSPLLRPDAAGGPGRPDAATAADAAARADPAGRPDAATGPDPASGASPDSAAGPDQASGAGPAAAVAADSADDPVEPAGWAARAVAQILEYLRGDRREFELPLDRSAISGDMRAVLDELCVSAPYGKVITYGELARRSGCPGGARAVGQIMARNPLPLVIPCHRVVAVGDLGGYGGGLALKRRLLRLEGALTEQLSLLGDP